MKRTNEEKNSQSSPVYWAITHPDLCDVPAIRLGRGSAIPVDGTLAWLSALDTGKFMGWGAEEIAKAETLDLAFQGKLLKPFSIT
jgi:hypothetical protein